MALSLLERAKGRIWLGGSWQEGTAGTKTLVSPATEEPLGEVGQASVADLDRAVALASEVHEEERWSGLPSLERGRILARAAALLRERELDFQAVISAETGMPPSAARFIEVPMAAEVFDYFAGRTGDARGTVEPFNLPGATSRYLVLTIREPVGVTGLITPWNFPLLMPAWKVAAALAAACPVILKPAPETPLTALLLAETLAAAGLPEGVLSVLPGDDELGRAVVRHPGIPRVSLTGGLEAGKDAMAGVFPGKRLTLELGGKSPLLIFADVDVEAAVDAALFGVFLNSGQVCQASSRVLVEERVYPEFLARLVARAAELKVGPPSDTTADIGPVISRARLEAIDAMVAAARAEGVRVETGGSPLPGPGFYYPPTVLSGVRPEMAIAQEEVFGPVVAVLPFRDEDEAIRLANATTYGLTAAVWTTDIKRALRVVGRLAAGTVWVNAVQVLTPTAPFGGMKASGLGRELGRAGLESYQEVKTVIVDGNDWPLRYF